jgi:hypothetical protein
MSAAVSMESIKLALLTYFICTVISLGVAGIIKILFVVIKKQRKIIFSIVKMQRKKAAAKESAIKTDLQR